MGEKMTDIGLNINMNYNAVMYGVNLPKLHA